VLVGVSKVNGILSTQQSLRNAMTCFSPTGALEALLQLLTALLLLSNRGANEKLYG